MAFSLLWRRVLRLPRMNVHRFLRQTPYPKPSFARRNGTPWNLRRGDGSAPPNAPI
jgi:hypothetical protein